jgi:hypothetical protein
MVCDQLVGHFPKMKQGDMGNADVTGQAIDVRTVEGATDIPVVTRGPVAGNDVDWLTAKSLAEDLQEGDQLG